MDAACVQADLRRLMDSGCLPVLVDIGISVLPPDLRGRLRRLEAGELEQREADAARAELRQLARLLRK